MKKIIKWAAYCFAAFCAFCILVATCSDDKESDNQKQTEQKVESNKQNKEIEAKKETIEKKEDSIFGTYEITDKVGCTIHLTINEDKTATITGVRGENKTFYCSTYESSMDGLWITCSDERPYIVFDGGVYEGAYKDFSLKDGWFYSEPLKARANNPEWRLKAKKIK